MVSIVVVIGTDHHRFQRLVRWADDRQRRHPEDQVLVQYGQSSAPEVAVGRAYLESDELRRRMAQADVVITHGGPGAIRDARRSGHRPIVFPRSPKRHEHVDDHQQRFAAWGARRGLIERATTRKKLDARLRDGGDTRIPPEDSAVGGAAVASFAEIVSRPTVSRSSAVAGSPRVLWLLDGAASWAAERRWESLPGALLLGSVVDTWPTAVSGLGRCACGTTAAECPFWDLAVKTMSSDPSFDAATVAEDALLVNDAQLRRASRRRHPGRKGRVALFRATTPHRRALVAAAVVSDARLLVVRGPLEQLLVLSHDRQLDLHVLELGLSRRQKRALRHRRVPTVTWSQAVATAANVPVLLGALAPAGYLPDHEPDVSLVPDPE